MEALYYETSNILQQIHYGLIQMEKAKDESEGQKFVQNVYEQLKITDTNCKRLDAMVSKEPPTRRRNIKYKVDQLKYDFQALNSTVSSLHLKLTNKWRAMAEREELLTTRFRANESTNLPIDDGELELNDRLRTSHRSLDDLISHGSAVLEQIQSQGFNMRGIKRKVLDVGQHLGLSSTTLRVAQRRVSEDWIIFCVGCIFVCLFMYGFYRYWKV